MQWMVVVCAFGLMAMLALKWRMTVFRPRSRIRLRRLTGALEKTLARLLALPQDQRSPAAHLLCGEARFVQKEAFEALHDQKGIPSLPCDVHRQPGVCLFVQAWLQYTDCVFTPDGLTETVRARMEEEPLTENELRALPLALRAELLRTLPALARDSSPEAAQRMQHALTSLRLMRHAPWERMLESLSPLHAAFQADPVYRAMTAQSRAACRQKAAAMARRTRRSEDAVAEAVWALCQRHPTGTVEAHTGYYLLDDGYGELVHQLHAMTLSIRLGLFAARHACGLYRLASWLVFAGSFALAWYIKLSALLWLPLSALALCGARRMFDRRKADFVPRMALSHLDEGSAALIVCPAVLHDAKEALAAVKHLSILQKGNPDAHLHFLLLGEYPDGLRISHGSEAEVIPAASAAVEALCEASGAAFFYFQRERTCERGAQAALRSIARLLCGQPAIDSYAFTSVEPAALQGRYRFLIPLDADVLLPPGSALELAGAMLHPLCQRRRQGHHMRGAGVLMPVVSPAPHQQKSRLSAWLGASSALGCIGDPAAFADSDAAPSPRLFLEWAGWRPLADTVLYAPPPQTLEGEVMRQHQCVRESWQCLPILLGFFAKHQPRRALDLTSRFRLWRNLLDSLIPPLQLAAVLLCASGGQWGLWLFALLIPSGLRRAAFLPCSAYACADAIARTLFHMFTGRQLPLRWSLASRRGADRPPMLLFSLQMGCAGLFALLTLLPSASPAACWLTAAMWALFAFVLPYLEQDRTQQRKNPTAYMREMLLRTAKHTLSFFETAITPAHHALPPERVQIDPNKGIAHHTTPEAIGLYLCALISAQKLGLMAADDMALRMDGCLRTLEALPKWKGLPYAQYDTHTLAPHADGFVSTEGCGVLLVSLLTCAQGIRALRMPDPASLAERMDALAQGMQVEALYSESAQLFYTGLETANEQPSAAFESLLASPCRLLSFAAVMTGRVPMAHWHALGRVQDRGALISESGGMDEYLLPLLFQPLVSNTLLASACRKAFARQRRNRLGRAFGISSGACFSFDEELHYQHRAFGLPSLALHTDAEATLLAPYAAFLALPLNLKAAFVNIQRLDMLGLQGQLGFFEGADFSRARTGGDPMRIVRCHTAVHQAIILCAICNALCGDYLSSLFSHLPSAQAFRLLLEEPPLPPARHSRRELRMALPDAPPEGDSMHRTAQPLHFPVDAHMLCGADTRWLIDAQGGGFIRQGGVLLTRFSESCREPPGMRIYLRDSQSGAYWQAADPNLTDEVQFETAQAVFMHTRFDISCRMQLWVNPLDGSAVHCLTLDNRSGAERVMEVCSYLHPAFSSASIARLCRSGISARHGKQRIWHLLTAPKPLSLIRMQGDRLAFLGRGRTFHAPRALEYPISAVADTLGERTDACISLRAQFTLQAGETAVLCYVTRMADATEDASAFCERYAKADAILRTLENARLSRAIALRFLPLSAQEQALFSRLMGALAYTGQPGQGGDAHGLRLSGLQAFGLDEHQPMLLAECGADAKGEVAAQLLRMHAFLRLSGFAYDLVFALLVRTRASAARDMVEEAIAQSHSKQWLNQRGGVYVIERADEEELALLRCAARMTVQADTPLENQLSLQSVCAHPLYLPKPSSAWKSRLPDAGALVHANGYGGFTVPEGDYQITLAPGTNTPQAWCNPLGAAMACESGLLPTDGLEETFYLRDHTHRLLFSPTRQPLGHGMPVRVTHAPGETTYECSVYGLSIRLCCFADSEHPARLSIIRIQNDDASARSLTLMPTCLFPAFVRLEAQEGCLRGWNPADGTHAALFALEPERCQPTKMSEGMFQGLWSRAPFALTTQEKLRSGEGSAGILSFPFTLEAGESAEFACGMATATSGEDMDALVSRLRSQGASERLHAARALWESRLGVFHFDLPDAALSVLMSRWLPDQALTAACCAPLAYSQPETCAQWLAEQAVQAERADLSARLQIAYAAACCAEITGGRLLLSQKVSEAETLMDCCLRLCTDVPLGAHDLPKESGETVWLGMLLCEALRRLAPFCETDVQQALHQKRENLLDALEKHAWDGAGYRYGWDADGQPVNTRQPDVITQCWAVMCGASRDRCETAMENAWRALSENGKEKRHALHAFWAAAAFHQLGHNDRAWAAVHAALPLARTVTRQQAARYQAEPYALAETLTDGRGTGAWHWAGVGWCWWIVLEQLIGFRKQGRLLRLSPAVPQAWDAVHITYRFGSATYHLHALRSCTQAMADGAPLADGRLTLADDGKVHEAFFPMR